ncbi:hypothetical protein [Streptomyces sp. SID3212]|uniref:hypothetical protein n=1 Tax=Streptomyces sp. SID3212 TaxID=2690259 RepID=UPI00136BDE2C|nr:hypothetical protein [Streptomyces sp. SID3212]MYV54590.1 hypothetical protein [Streptomyces sp. SID3212]
MRLGRTRTRIRTRTLAALALVTATGLFLTACNSDSVADGSASSSSSSPSTGDGADPGTGEAADPTPTADAGDDASDDANAAAGSGTDNGPVDNPDAPGADGTFSGVLTYLAPGKLLVGERAFWVAVDTEIVGGDICGDPETPEAEKCTPDDLDAAAKNGNLNVEVTITKGIAERVHQAS